ncbi:MAG: phosphomannomutase [Thiohalocapsa sp.]|nr:phosphomannomutase [Thiohalocapsa sp.]
MRISDLMSRSGVKFGTSGARGRVVDMTDRVCYAYARGFVDYLIAGGAVQSGAAVGIAGDFRPSSARIIAACARAVTAAGCVPRYFGRIPTPALAAYGIESAMPTMMVTGSHIPDDRNGIKFNLPSGEILKEDEAGIRARDVDLPDEWFDAHGAFADGVPDLPPEERAAYDAYVARFLDFFPSDCLAGLRIGLYEHSSVMREAAYAVLTGLGADVERLGFSETFIPVDTEAIRPEDDALARDWCADGRFDALVSADGDGDRPLVADEHGRWLRGDIAGILCARALGAAAVVTPVSSNTALERSGWFPRVVRTRIGSPYVVAAMQALSARGVSPVVGYEANGGFLTDSEILRDGKRLAPLPTRDAVIVAVAVLAAAKTAGKPVSALADDLPMRFTYSDRIKDFPVEVSGERLRRFATGDEAADRRALEVVFADHFGPIESVDHTDGVRMGFANGEIAHLRPSGNAPELRAYTEAATAERAREMNALCMEILRGWRQ